MTDSKDRDPLLEWNRLNIENAEQGFVSALFQSITETTTAADKFSMWLLAGTGATGALLISQVNSILPFLSSKGFKMCMVFLVVSALLGFVAKYKALKCEMQIQMQTKLQELVLPIFEQHEKDEDQIKENAAKRGIEVETEINFVNVLNDFSKTLPWWSKLLMARQIKKSEGDERQAGHRFAFNAYIGQLRWTFFQACFYLAFMMAGAYYSNAI